MNPFSTFSFSGFIKTFLPGFLLCVTALLTVQSFIPETGKIVANNKEIAIVVAIIASIILGLLCNTLSFCWILDLFIRVKSDMIKGSEHSELFSLKTTIEERIISIYSSKLNLDLKTTKLDVNGLVLHKDNMPIRVYWMDSYWFYLEFQLNFAISLFILGIAGTVIGLKAMIAPNAFYGGAITCAGIVAFDFFIFILCMSLVGAAKRNYIRHVNRLLGIAIVELIRLTSEENKNASK